MVRNQYTAEVREDSKGQKTITVPKDADIDGGDSIKFKKTRHWGYNQIEQAKQEAREKAAEEWQGPYYSPDPEDIGFHTHMCNVGEQRNTCLRSFLKEKELKQHLQEDHELEEDEIDMEEHQIKQWCIGGPDFSRFMPHLLRALDIENRDLHADEVGDTIEEIVERNDLGPQEKLEKLHDYANNVREKHLQDFEQ